ncbi:MAG: hypothetical protein CMH56_09530 [Myxococcales bacterium]|nr:hypothetical protein [Myxococcales bacterium]
MRLLLLLVFCFLSHAPAAWSFDYQLAPPVIEGHTDPIPENPENWEMRLTQRERTQYLNTLRRENQRFWLGYIMGAGAAVLGPLTLSVPFAMSVFPLALAGALGPAPLMYTFLSTAVVFAASNALIQSLATHWLLNQSRYYQFKMLPGFLANLVGQGLTFSIFMGLSGTALGMISDPAVAWQRRDFVTAELGVGSLGILGALALGALTYVTLPPLMGTWMMMKNAAVRPGFRVIRPAPETTARFEPVGGSGVQTPLLAFQF